MWLLHNSLDTFGIFLFGAWYVNIKSKLGLIGFCFLSKDGRRRTGDRALVFGTFGDCLYYFCCDTFWDNLMFWSCLKVNYPLQILAFWCNKNTSLKGI